MLCLQIFGVLVGFVCLWRAWLVDWLVGCDLPDCVDCFNFGGCLVLCVVSFLAVIVVVDSVGLAILSFSVLAA